MKKKIVFCLIAAVIGLHTDAQLRRPGLFRPGALRRPINLLEPLIPIDEAMNLVKEGKGKGFYQIAIRYASGNELPEDKNAAYKMLCKACDLNYANAILVEGMLDEGNLRESDTYSTAPSTYMYCGAAFSGGRREYAWLTNEVAFARVMKKYEKARDLGALAATNQIAALNKRLADFKREEQDRIAKVKAAEENDRRLAAILGEDMRQWTVDQKQKEQERRERELAAEERKAQLAQLAQIQEELRRQREEKQAEEARRAPGAGPVLGPGMRPGMPKLGMRRPPMTGAAGSAAAGASGGATEGMSGLDIARARRLERIKQMQVEAEQQRQVAEQSKREREQERREREQAAEGRKAQLAQLMQIQEELRRQREEKENQLAEVEAARQAAEAAEAAQMRQALLPKYQSALKELIGYEMGQKIEANLKSGSKTVKLEKPYRYFDDCGFEYVDGCLWSVYMKFGADGKYSYKSLKAEAESICNDLAKRFDIKFVGNNAEKHGWRFHVWSNDGIVVYIKDEFLQKKLQARQNEKLEAQKKVLPVFGEGK